MKYRCRSTIPEESIWFDIEAETPEQAANDFHADFEHHFKQIHHIAGENGSRYEVKFVKVEVEGHEEFVSRLFHYKIFRKGGVKSLNTPTLKDIADKLGWAHDSEKLLSEDEEDWTGVETMEEAKQANRS